jgi:hypothetical protein
MSVFRVIQEEDVINDKTIVTSGLFQDGVSSITTFFTSSVQSGSTGDYSLDVFRFSPSTNTSASVQFGVAYGHYAGSGSKGGVGVVGERPSAAVHSQFNQLINPPQTTRFVFGSHTAEDIFVLAMNRARIREQMEPGGWELHLSGSNAGPGGTKIKLIDDSSTNKGGNTARRNFSPEYNIVSGTLVGGRVIKTAASDEGAAGTYGKFYPSIGVLVLNVNRLEQDLDTPSGGQFKSGSNADGGNNDKFVTLLKNAAFFSAKRQEEITSTHYFVRAKANQFNATTNESFYTESVAGVKRIVPGLLNDPKTYITTVGMYNDSNELIAIAKLSKPIIKSKSREALIKVKLDF